MMLDFKKGNKPFGDWCIQLGLGLVSGAVVAVAANILIAAYALVVGIVLFSVGVSYRYTKSKKR